MRGQQLLLAVMVIVVFGSGDGDPPLQVVISGHPGLPSNQRIVHHLANALMTYNSSAISVTVLETNLDSVLTEPSPSYTTVVLESGFSEEQWNEAMASMQDVNPLMMLSRLTPLSSKMCSHIVQAHWQQLVAEVTQAHLFIGDQLWPCNSLLISELRPKRHVWVAASGYFDPVFTSVRGIAQDVGWIPSAGTFLGSARAYDFPARVWNSVAILFNRVAARYYIWPPYEYLLADGVYRDVRKSYASGSLLFPGSFAIEPSRSFPPSVILKGAWTTGAPQPLSPFLREFFMFTQRRQRRVIVVASGSQHFPSLQENAMLFQVLADSGFNVLWSLRDDARDGLPDLPRHIHVSSSMPLNDILAQPEVALFISHGGYHSLYEAVFHTVPSICIPRYGDQHDNCNKLRALGLTNLLPLISLTTENLQAAIEVALGDSDMQNNIRRTSSILQSENGLKSAVDHIEHVWKYGDSHLQSGPTLAMAWWQYWNVDLLLFWILFVFVGGLFLILTSCSFVLSFCCNLQLTRTRAPVINPSTMRGIEQLLKTQLESETKKKQ